MLLQNLYGVITQNDLERGQVVSGGDAVVSMVSESFFEIESFIPEVSIAGVNVGDEVEMIFDAFGPDTLFKGYVAHIDPRETIKDGITTYRILIDFLEEYTEILSGMNVEVKIIKDKEEDQVVIPRYLIESDEQGRYVTKVVNEKEERVSVELGKRDSSGNVVVISGVDEGDVVVIPE
jgi:multidrug efflux pump subunit AcrA (membrane-fusion protein)